MSFQKICNYLSILSTLLCVGIIGGSFVTYKYLTSEQFKNKMLNSVAGRIQGNIPKMIDKAIPEMTAPATPIPFKLTEEK